MGCLKLENITHPERVSPLKILFSSVGVLEKKGYAEKNRCNSYRYGFNGMEGDPEVKGSGNSYTTEFRQYDSRLGRWLSLDPITHHNYSPYSSYDNNPIYFSDPSGADSEDPKDESKRHTKEERAAIIEQHNKEADEMVEKIKEEMDTKIDEAKTYAANLKAEAKATRAKAIKVLSEEWDYPEMALDANFGETAQKYNKRLNGLKQAHRDAVNEVRALRDEKVERINRVVYWADESPNMVPNEIFFQKGNTNPYVQPFTADGEFTGKVDSEGNYTLTPTSTGWRQNPIIGNLEENQRSGLHYYRDKYSKDTMKAGVGRYGSYTNLNRATWDTTGTKYNVHTNTQIEIFYRMWTNDKK